ncbi:MAG: DUF433 domain-containing protein [Acidobacteriota bacterium]|nr:DUF433 domain-containing protein [Acidobacteriota bacterium]
MQSNTAVMMEKDMELISDTSPLFGIVWVNPARVSGAPCFDGTRVPVKNLFDYLKGGDSLEIFLEDFEGVTREQAVKLLAMAERAVLAGVPQG